MEPIGHYCEFYGVYHSSSSCFHPGRALLHKVEAERDELKEALDDTRELLELCLNMCPMDIDLERQVARCLNNELGVPEPAQGE